MPAADEQPPTDPEQTLAGGDLVLRRSGDVVHLVFNRPHRHNAFTSGVYTALLAVCEELRQDPTVRTVVLAGAGGRAFAAGNEIAEFTGVLDGAAGVAYEARIRRVLRSLLELPQVTIAAIDGVCVGGGLAVATHCDLRIATESSRFGYPIARTLGNALSATAVHRCVAVFGESLTREMLLASRLVDAHRAHAVGALMSVVPSGGLAGEVVHVVQGLRSAAPLTLRTTKHQLLQRIDVLEREPQDDDRWLADVYGSEDFREGVRAFLAKERPRFRGV